MAETMAVAGTTNAVPAMSALTAESKHKGDEGIRSAMDALRLARALRGVSLSRLAFQQSLGPLSSTKPTLLLGMPPAVLPNNNTSAGGEDERVQPEQRVIDTHNAVVLSETLHDLPHATVAAVAHCATQLAIDVPDAELRAAAQDVLPFVTQLQPGRAMSYEDAVRLLAALATPELRHVTTLNLSRVVCPGAQPPAAAQTLMDKMNELRLRYPLPTKKHKSGEENGDEEEEEEEEDEASMAHNAELKARCEQLQLPHAARYERALQSLAEYEMRVFPLLCHFLCTNQTLRVLRLDHNGLGAAQNGATTASSSSAAAAAEAAAEAGGVVDLSALRALARMLDANEHLQLLDLSHNALGANGVGIVAKALTKNIALLVVDLSENDLNAEPGEVSEDPLYEGEDAVFGEPRTGLDALSELLKKNKFLRVLRLAGNGLHGGADGAGAAEAESVLEDFQPDTDGTLVQDPRLTAENATARTLLCPALQELIESWEELPLWKLVQPLQQFHRLQVLDLANNQLRVSGTRMLAAALACNRALRVLDLTNNEIGFRGLHYLANLVLRSPCSVLHTLILRRNGLAGKKTSKAQQKAALRAMQAFAEAMKGNTTVRRLLLANNHLGPVLSAALLATLSEAGALEELDFDMNDACGEHAASFDPAAAHAIAALLHPAHAAAAQTADTASASSAARPCALRVLRFAGNNLRPQGLGLLFPAGCTLPASLHSLYLARNELGHGSLGPLALAMRASTTLTSLDLSYNAIASAGELLAGLTQHASLAYVNLAHNKLGSVTTSLLSSAAVATTTVQTAADDAAASIQLRETCRLFDALASMPALARLDLSWNDLLASHMEGLMASLTRHAAAPSLRWLDVRFNPKVPASVVAALVRTLGARAGLQVLYLSLPNNNNNNSNSNSASTAAPGDEAETEGTTTQSLLREMEAAVERSETLLDLNCGLGSRGTAALDEAEETTAGQLIGQMRRRLLLNALLANCDANKMH